MTTRVKFPKLVLPVVELVSSSSSVHRVKATEVVEKQTNRGIFYLLFLICGLIPQIHPKEDQLCCGVVNKFPRSRFIILRLSLDKSNSKLPPEVGTFYSFSPTPKCSRNRISQEFRTHFRGLLKGFF